MADAVNDSSRYESHRQRFAQGGRIGGGLQSDGGGGNSGGMDARIAALEGSVKRIETDVAELRSDSKTALQTLARIDSKLDNKADGASVAEILGKLASKAEASSLAEVSAKLDDRPTTWRVFLIVMLLGGLIFAANFGRGTIFPGTAPQVQQQR